MGFFSRKKETVDEEKVRLLFDLFYVSCALADTADWGLICLVFNERGKLLIDVNENYTIGTFIGHNKFIETLNNILSNPSRDFPCSYDTLQWYFKAMNQGLDSGYDFRKNIFNLIPEFSRNIEKEYYNAFRAYLKKNLSDKAYSRIEFEEKDYAVVFKKNI